MNPLSRYPWILALLVLAAPIGHAADKSLADAAKTIASKLEAGCIVTGEWREGKATYALAGQAPEGTTAPEDVLFEIGSISKTFTGLLLAQAVVEGKVKLETTIGELLGPDQKFADPRVGNITLVQLSTHTSGLPRLPTNHVAGVVAGDPYAKYNEKLLLAFLSTVKLKGEAPFRGSYSNVGVGLLGHLLAKIYGEPTWEAAVVKKVCAPLGLTHTRVDISELKLPLAPPYSGAKKDHNWTFDAMAGAGALRSTAADLIAYGQAVLHPERTPLKEAFALALSPHAEFGSLGGHIGLGFFIRKINGSTTYSHSGGTGGYRTMLQVQPAKETAHIVLINNGNTDGSEVLAAASPKPSTKNGPKPKEITLPAQDLKPFAGVYDVDQDTRFTVLLDEATPQLWVRLTGQTFLKVFPRSPNRVFYKAVDAEIEFNRANDQVVGLTLFQNGGELKAHKTPSPPPKVKLHSAEELKPYAGNYSLMGQQKFQISVRGNTLFAKLGEQSAAPIFETKPDRFEFDVVEAAVVFTRNDAQEINGLMLLQNGLTLPAPRELNPGK